MRSRARITNSVASGCSTLGAGLRELAVLIEATVTYKNALHQIRLAQRRDDWRRSRKASSLYPRTAFVAFNRPLFDPERTGPRSFVMVRSLH